MLRASRFGITGQATLPGEPTRLSVADHPLDHHRLTWRLPQGRDRLTVSTGSYGSASGLSGGSGPVAGAGAGGQIVTYTVTYVQPFLTGAWVNLVGRSGSLTHQATVVVKNEPFDNATC